jgi:NADH-quinone oxidoreductase subunit L
MPHGDTHEIAMRATTTAITAAAAREPVGGDAAADPARHSLGLIGCSRSPLLFGSGFGESIFFERTTKCSPRSARSSATWAFGCALLAPGVLPRRRRRVRRLGAVHQVAAPAGVIDSKLKPLRWILENKYGFDWFNENVLAPAGRCSARSSGRSATRPSSTACVDGSARTIGFVAGVVRRVQSGFLYSYAFWMVIGLAVMLGWFLTH